MAVLSLVGAGIYQHGHATTVAEIAASKLEVLRIENQKEHEDIKSVIAKKWEEHTEIRKMIYDAILSNNDTQKRQEVLIERIAAKVGVLTN